MYGIPVSFLSPNKKRAYPNQCAELEQALDFFGSLDAYVTSTNANMCAKYLKVKRGVKYFLEYGNSERNKGFYYYDLRDTLCGFFNI
jgi:hypothetical protein